MSDPEFRYFKKNFAAEEAERAKDDAARAEDIAYTINHALACTATDIIDPFIGNATQNYLGKRISVGHHGISRAFGIDDGHNHGAEDHAHGPDCNHHHPKQGWWKKSVAEVKHMFLGGHLKEWVVGEIAGDIGAVPLTVSVQKYAPGFMKSLGSSLESVSRPFFRWSAIRSANKWAREHNIDRANPVVIERAESIYNHEMSHLPQAMVWSTSSIAINVATQRVMTRNKETKSPLSHLLIGKTIGAAMSLGIVLGLRLLAPQAAKKWDEGTSKNIFLPMTRTVGKAFGVTKEDVQRMTEKQAAHNDEGKWLERARQSEPTNQLSR